MCFVLGASTYGRGSMCCCLWNEAWMPSVPPPHPTPACKLKESLSYIISFQRANQWINESMGRYEQTLPQREWTYMCTHTNTHQIFTIDMSNPVNHASNGSGVWREKRLYVRENMVLDLTVAHGQRSGQLRFISGGLSH